MMGVVESCLAAVLDHCRSLFDAADHLEQIGRERDRTFEVTIRIWEGPHRVTFENRYREESVDRAQRVRGLRAEADAWAAVWADEVNRINRECRSEAVAATGTRQGFGEGVLDLYIGDDSGGRVRAFDPVVAPTAVTRFTATGGLETF